MCLWIPLHPHLFLELKFISYYHNMKYWTRYLIITTAATHLPSLDNNLHYSSKASIFIVLCQTNSPYYAVRPIKWIYEFSPEERLDMV